MRSRLRDSYVMLCWKDMGVPYDCMTVGPNTMSTLGAAPEQGGATPEQGGATPEQGEQFRRSEKPFRGSKEQ